MSDPMELILLRHAHAETQAAGHDDLERPMSLPPYPVSLAQLANPYEPLLELLHLGVLPWHFDTVFVFTR